MRKLILEEWLTLDGFASDTEGGLDFFRSNEAATDKKLDEDQLKFLDNIDAILLGRKTYDLFKEFWPDASVESEIIADKLNSTDKFVFSNTLVTAPWGKWASAHVIEGDATDSIGELKRKDGKSIVMWGSISLAQALLKERLIDELHIFLCPVVLGIGRPFFQGVNEKALCLKDVRQYSSGIVFLNYQVQSGRS